jgi:hypothetical protein
MVALKFTMKKRLVQAYRQAPWRKQAQWIAMFFAGLLFFGVVIYMYLSASQAAATAGRDIQILQYQRANLRMQIADENTLLAETMSIEAMRPRAKDLGFESFEPNIATFVPVPGYVQRYPANLAPKAGPNQVQKAILQPDYTLSLWDWLLGSFTEANSQPEQVSP